MKTSNQRVVYGQTLLEIGAADPRVVVLEADLGNSTQSIHFQKAYQERYFEMGIAEANMTSFAAGLSLTGKVAITNSFAVFAAGRAYDQIRQGVAIGSLNVKVVGSSAGFSDFGDGATHQSVDDVAIMRAIPNMTVLVPADGPQTAAMVRWMVAHDGPVYLRISRNDLPELTGESPDPIAPAVLHDGSDVALVACGIMVDKAMKAAEQLVQKGISARVINVPCLKPFPDEALKKLLEDVKAVVTCEEHSYIGGLSQATAWMLRGDDRPLEAIAVQDTFGQSAYTHEELLTHYHLQVDDIAQTAEELLNRKENRV